MVIKNIHKTEKTNPLAHANIFSKSTFWWLKDFINYGSKYDLKSENLYGVLEKDETELLGNDLEEVWLKECCRARKNKKGPKFFKCMMKLYGNKFCKYSVIYIFMAAFQIIQPLTLELIMPYFDTPPKVSSLQAYLYATMSVILLALTAIFRRYGFFKLTRLGMDVKIACSSLIYKKLLRLSSSLKNGNAESIINLLSNDVVRFELMCCFLPFLFIIPLQTVFVVYLVSRYIGITTACATILLLLLQSLPIQALYYKITAKLKVKQAAKTDERVSFISEILHAIRIIKMYSWQQYFESSVFLQRKNEIAKFLTMSHISSIALSTMHFVHRWCIFFLALTFILKNEALTPAQIIPVMQYLAILRESLTVSFSDTIKNLADAVASIKRIEDFLVQAEVESNVKSILNNRDDKSIKIKDVTASWYDDNSCKALKDINLEMGSGKLYVAIGPVGCGKSTLLKLILGEITPKTGEIFVCGRVSYASQEPWLFNGSIKDNILFGDEYDKIKYEKVITACALSEDFTQLPYGDKTLVGEKGMSLSGGQRTRINLARAVYRNADIYLLDDPLSSVDSRVARKLFVDCIDGLLKDKIRILTTHNRTYLDRAHSVMVMSDGLIQYQGSVRDLESHGLNLCDMSIDGIERPMEKIDNMTVIENSTEEKKISTESENQEDEPKETEELLAQGSISKGLILKYIKASKSFFLFSLGVLSIVIVILLCTTFDYLIVTWTQTQELLRKSAVVSTDVTKFLAIFGSLILAITVMSILRNLVFYKFMFNANLNIHNSMFTALMKAPLKFFETNPSGRTMNRFTEDVGVSDDQLTRFFSVGSDDMIEAFACLLPILIINWWLSISIAIIGYLVFKTHRLCAPTLRGVIRLEAIAKSPILSFAITSSVGKEIIRAYNAEKIVNRIFNSHQDKHTAAHFLYIACYNAFASWLDLSTAVLFFFVVYTSLILKSTSASAASIGLALMQTGNLSVFISATVRILFFSTYGCLVNVERMFQITKLEPEECPDEPATKVSKSWPTVGKIQFVNLYLNYSDDDLPILKNLNITIESQTKVGVVGRTGAGKSSLISALFRLAKLSGTILIDGIDTKRITLKELRSKISIIPQEPILFSASLRSNLDPFNEFDDATLWAAIESVELKKVFFSLDQTIERGGCNLSLGQRQLVCLARAIVRSNKILVLDEATANIDPETDTLIQKTLRSKFADCTVITIAHRLNTVMDSDKILVMDNGQIVEYDHSDVLLKNRNGHFYKMTQQMNVVPDF